MLRSRLPSRSPSISASLSVAIVLSCAACGGSKRTIRIPDSVVQNPKHAAQPGAPHGEAAQPYVIKMSDGRRTWQIEIPMGQGSPNFQAAIPLDLGDASLEAPSTTATEADREIDETRKSHKSPAHVQGGSAPPSLSTQPASGAQGTAGAQDAQAQSAQPKRSYLATLARVSDLFRRRQYEIALMDVVALDREYPDDERVLEMKGTLHFKLRQPKLARQAWERVLAIDPDNTVVAQALEQLLQEGE